MAEQQVGHTPGPWEVGTRAADNTIFESVDTQLASVERTHVHNGQGSIASIYAPSGAVDEAEANTRLIAAAPNLLAAAEAAVRWQNRLPCTFCSARPTSTHSIVCPVPQLEAAIQSARASGGGRTAS